MGPKRKQPQAARSGVSQERGYSTKGKKKGTLNTPQQDDSDEEGYVCTGVFKEDFSHFCVVQGLPYIPPVVARAGPGLYENLPDTASRPPSPHPAPISSNNQTTPSPSPPKSKQTPRKSVSDIGKTLVTAVNKKDRDDTGKSATAAQKKDKKQKKEEPLKKAEPKEQQEIQFKSFASMVQEFTGGDKNDPSKNQRRLSDASYPDQSLEKVTYNTFTTKESSAIFTPKIQADFLNGEEQGVVTELYIRDWKVDAQMMEALGCAMQFSCDLRSLSFWNTALDDSSLRVLYQALVKTSDTLTSLSLDNNPLADLSVSCLLDDQSSLLELSLRFCQLTDLNATSLGNALGTIHTSNTKLLHLNLSNNKIGDKGCRGLAEGLLMNRHLLTLNLAGNCIGDEGAVALAHALGNAPLSPAQMFERRKKLSAIEAYRTSHAVDVLHVVEENSPPPTSPSKPSKHGKTPAPSETGRSETGRSETGKSETGKSESGKGKGKSSSGSSSRMNKGSAHDTGRKRRNSKPQKARARWHRAKECVTTSLTQLAAHRLDKDHPLAEAGALVDGTFCIVGNRCLLSLNLSRNRIGQKGIRSLYEALQDQVEGMPEQRQTSTGLKRLVVQRNAVARDDLFARRIDDYLYRKEKGLLAKPAISPGQLYPFAEGQSDLSGRTSRVPSRAQGLATST